MRSSRARDGRRCRTWVWAWALVLGQSAVGDAEDAITINTNFEGGSLGTIERRGPADFRLHVRGQQDEHGRNRQASWYYFRMDGVQGRDLTITMTDYVGEYNGKAGACPMGPEIVPVWSLDGETWRPLPDLTWDDQAKEATIRLRPEGPTIWLAHQEPYTNGRLARLLEEVDRAADARIEVIGQTLRGRDLKLITVTAPAVDDREKATVGLMARQHAWESGTSFVMEGALRWLTSDDEAAIALRRRVVFLVVPMADPDGVAAGQVRFNANGYDLNRHWDEVDLRSKRYLSHMPEIWAIKKAIVARVDAGREIDLFLNLHNTETAEYLETMADGPAIRSRLGRLSERLIHEAGFRPSRGPVFGAPRSGTANVLFAEKGVPMVLMEQRIGRAPGQQRPPEARDRLEFGARLIRIMGESVRP